ncbi:MAG: tRNA uridine-5-carboxymethylaminomethyl(34) synthesis GTPase MnmE [Lachnospiraceae bacterium]|nr:tRNA uridine-5-carboxymethylaminomethyl(34) synthesis GTPase MnmE [Lachnospiraceae bacterium]
MKNNTIAAIATAPGSSGISIIRISGDEAFLVADRVFRHVGGKKLSESPGFRAYFGKIYDKNEPIDEVIALVMRGPKSYTGEDSVEISCHGGILVTRRILECVLHAGASMAEPGEFTKRAFLNGRIDLSQAEAVIDLIDAKNEFAVKSSLSQLDGRLSDRIRAMRAQILDAMSYIEAALDDPEHISLEGYEEEFTPKIVGFIEEIQDLIKNYDDSKVLKSGIKTVILGKPNAGKSSLLNLFAGRDLAIVTDIAGTTRDVISEQINISGIGFEIIDTAGIRQTGDVVEKIGVSRSISAMEGANLLLYVVDSSTELDENDRHILSIMGDRKVIIVYNKTDLSSKVDETELRALSPHATIIKMSAGDGTGFDKLKECMVSMFNSGSIAQNDQVIITNLRHKEALNSALTSLRRVLESIEGGFGEDLWNIDLQDAYESLGLIIGEAVGDDVVNNIFAKFCMGK